MEMGVFLFLLSLVVGGSILLFKKHILPDNWQGKAVGVFLLLVGIGLVLALFMPTTELSTTNVCQIFWYEENARLSRVSSNAQVSSCAVGGPPELCKGIATTGTTCEDITGVHAFVSNACGNIIIDHTGCGFETRPPQ